MQDLAQQPVRVDKNVSVSPSSRSQQKRRFGGGRSSESSSVPRRYVRVNRWALRVETSST